MIHLLVDGIGELSVLSVEPYGMKRNAVPGFGKYIKSFSALGRAVWDETTMTLSTQPTASTFSALGRAVWDETLAQDHRKSRDQRTFSALGRAVWDETQSARVQGNALHGLSVLSVEPYGMKLRRMRHEEVVVGFVFQCSRSSRMG